MLFHVVAVARNRVIGKNNKLPWHFSSDLKHFKALTTGSTVIMGRKTFESIGKPLPNRENFVLSRTRSGSPAPHLYFFNSIETALKNVKTENAFIIGGAELYNQTMDKVNGIYLTRIDADYEGDAFYPEIPEGFDEIEIENLQDNPKIEVVLYEK
jgi:dihydrofolate reductase